MPADLTDVPDAIAGRRLSVRAVYIVLDEAGGELPRDAIEERVGLHEDTVRRALQDLEAAGVAVREPDASDPRRVHCRLVE